MVVEDSINASFVQGAHTAAKSEHFHSLLVTDQNLLPSTALPRWALHFEYSAYCRQTGSFIAAVRLARDDISRASPRVQSVIADSVELARRILESVVH
jgi:hypothetical protein